jgi:hypothetical protein
VAGHGVEEESTAADVVEVEDAGFGDGFGDQGFTGEVHDGVKAMLGKDGVEAGLIGEIDFVEDRPGRDGGAMAFAEIVEGNDVHAT